MKCRLCQSNVEKVFEHEIMGKHKVSYFLCGNCDLLQTEKPFWLEEAYSKPINDSDTGLLVRNIFLAIRSSIVFSFLFNRKSKFLDYAGGYGVFSRLMRDIGFDFYWNDPYTKNLFAINFESNKKDEYEALTSFESFEHFLNPLDDFEKMLRLSSNILLTTTLRKSGSVPSKDWWYYGFEHGQHISFYSTKTLGFLAKKYNIQIHTDGVYYSLFTKRKFNTRLMRIMLSRFAIILFPMVVILNTGRTQSDRKNVALKEL